MVELNSTNEVNSQRRPMLNTADAPFCLFKLDLSCRHVFLAEMSTYSFSSRHCRIFGQLFFCLLGCDKEKKKSNAKFLPGRH